MIRPFKTLVLLGIFLAAVLGLRAQGYTVSDVGRWHYSSAYFITLQDAGGESINSLYAKTTGAIGAFVGGELRGVSELGTVGPQGNQTVFLIRVWGDENDPAEVTFRIRDTRNGIEYVLGRQIFGQGEDATYGAPTSPIAMTLIPITDIGLTNENITLLPGATASTKPVFMPENHSEVASNLRTEYVSSDENVFTVTPDGIITGQKRGQATLTVNVYLDDKLCFRKQTYVSVLSERIDVTGIRNDMSSTDIVKLVGEQFKLDFTVLPENATNRQVEYSFSVYGIVDIIQEDEFSPATFVAAKPGTTTITVRTVDGGYTLKYNVTVQAPVVHVESITVEPKSVEVFVDESFTLNYDVLRPNAHDT